MEYNMKTITDRDTYPKTDRNSELWYELFMISFSI